MPSEDPGFDRHAALIRRAAGDQRAFIAGLAVRLAEALPGRVTVEHRGLALLGRRHVARIAVRFDADTLVLRLEGPSLVAERAKVVHGVVLRNERIGMPEWLAELADQASRLSDRSGAAQSALHDFLMS